MLKPQFSENDVQHFKQYWKEVDLSKCDLGPVRSDILAYVDEIDILQQQNKQLIEAVETAIMWMQGNEMNIKAGQLRQALESIQGASDDAK